MASLALALSILCLAVAAESTSSNCVSEDCEDAKLLQRNQWPFHRKKKEAYKTKGHQPQGGAMGARWDGAMGGVSAGDMSSCEGNNWCNGTLRGITEHLDYIQGVLATEPVEFLAEPGRCCPICLEPLSLVDW
eukprot:s48_g15.t1